jgi:multiple sugar transport system permease protein
MVAIPAKAERTARQRTAARHETITAYLFLMPYLLGTLIFTVGVIVFAVAISFTKFDLFTPPQWVGFDNYVQVFTEQPQRGFARAMVNIFWYVIIVMPLQTAAALGLAVLLNVPMRAKQFFRTIFYAPSVTSSVVISTIFLWLFLKNGYLNYGLDSIWGLFGAEWEAIDWLKDPKGLFQLILEPFGVRIPSSLWYLRGPSIAWMAIMLQNIFTTAPTFMIMFLAALQDIPPSLYEAASLDGATAWQKFTRITVPLLRPVILLVVVLGTIGTFQIFDQVKIMTAGEPLGTTLVPVYLIYTEALGENGPPRMGFACAMAFILAAIIFVFTFIQRRFLEQGTEQY